MKHNFKRFLSLLLALVMVIGLMPMGHVHAEAAIVGQAKVLSDNTVVSLEDCEYTFTPSGEYWQITGITASGETVYVNPCATNNAVTPQATGEANLKLYAGSAEGSMHISGSKGSLHFHNTEASPWWNKCGNNYDNKTDADHDVYFFKPSAAATDSVIPGYEKVTDLANVVEGKYLIAAVNTVGNWFVMHPSVIDSNDDTQKKDHIAQVFTAIHMNVGDTYEAELDGAGVPGTYGDEIVSAEVAFVPTYTKVVGVTPVTEIKSGTTYAIVAARSGSDGYGGTYANYYVSNHHVESARGNGDNGMELLAAFNESACWTITAVGEFYTISDGTSNLNIASNCNVNLAQDAQVQIVASEVTDNAWEIRNADGVRLNYFNSFGAASSTGHAASAWNNANDPGSQWYLYEVTEVPAYTYVKGDQLGQDDAIVGGGNYILYNLRQGKTLLNTTHPSQKAFLHLNGDLNNPTASSIWTINEAEDGKFYLQDANGQYVTFPRDGASMTDTQTALEIYWQNTHKYGDEDGNWLIKLDGEYLGNHGGPSAYKAGGWWEMPDGGAYWFLYEAIVTPVGTNVLTFTAESAGDTTITIGGESYCFHVHGWTDADCDTPKTCSGCGATEGEANGHNYELTNTTQPTCTEAGSKTFTCSVCQDSYNEPIPATDHSDADNDGNCDACNTELCEHSWDEATCTTPKTCSKCEKTEGSALGHSFTNYVSNNDATCTADGTKTAKCDRCDATDTLADEGSMLGHSFTNYIPNNDATCTADGTKTAKCERCDATDTLTDEGTKLEHSFTNYVSNEDATCTADGTMTAKCDNCDATDTLTDEGTKLEHSYTNDYDSTCNECGAVREGVKEFTSEKLTGLTGEASSNDANDGSNIEEAFDGIKDDASNYWASVANAAGIENNEYLIANLGGKYLINQVAYTSRTTAGAVGNLKNFTIWVKNGDSEWEEVASSTEVADPGTTTVSFAPVEATHVKLTATESCHWQDGTNGRPDNRNKVMAVAEFEVFKAVCLENDHDYDDGVETKAPTCNEGGVMLHTCKICGDTYESPTLPTNEHTYGDLIEAVEAVHTPDTLTPAVAAHYYCAACKTYFDEEKNETTLAALTGETPEHDENVTKTENVVAPTLDAAGSHDEVTYCSVCNKEMSRKSKVDPAIESKIVTWYDWNDTVLYELKVAADAEVVADQYVGEPPMRAEDESFTYEFEGWVTVEGGFKAEYTATAKEPVVEADKVVMLGKEVRLESEIQMQYRVSIPESLINSGAYVVMAKTGAYGEVTKTYTVAELKAGENLVTMGVAPAEITAPISITVYDGTGVAQDLYNKAGDKLENAARTVAGYAVELLKDENKKDLAVALLTYGGYAQQYFNVDANNPAFNLLANLGYTVPDLDAVTVDNMANYRNTQTNANMGVKATTVATYVDSNIRIRVYLAVEGDINGYTFSLKTPNGNKDVKAGYDQASKRYYVDITEIASAYIDFEYQITIKGANGTNVITASVLAYARSVLSKSTDEKLLNLAKALYLYNQAANAYYGV